MRKLTQLWAVHGWIVPKILDGFSEADYRKGIQGANSALWILGHINNSRKFLAKSLGMQVEDAPHDQYFAMGTKPADVPAEVTGEKVFSDFMQTQARFAEQLSGLDASALDNAAEVSLPVESKTLEGTVQFLFLHEAYHVGQLGTLRMQLGKPSWMAGM